MICARCAIDKPETAFELRADTGYRRRTCRDCRIAGRLSRPLPESKSCTACNKEKPIADFSLNDGRPRSRCKACEVASQTARWVGKDRTQRRAYVAGWRAENLEHARALARKYAGRQGAKDRAKARRATTGGKQQRRASYLRNAPKVKAAVKRWQRENPEKAVAIAQRRRSRLAGLPATVSGAEWEALLEYHDHRCAYCLRGDVALEMDHVVAVTRGGGTTPDNIVPACRSCNATKKNKPVFAMAAVLSA